MKLYDNALSLSRPRQAAGASSLSERAYICESVEKFTKFWYNENKEGGITHEQSRICLLRSEIESDLQSSIKAEFNMIRRVICFFYFLYNV